MRQLILIAVILGISATQTAAVRWDGLRVKFGPVPSDVALIKMPRTAFTAVAEGWQSVSTSCTNSGKYAGYRYRLGEDNTIYLLFDRNGVIAGIQVLVPHDEVLDPANRYRYDLVPMFQNDTISGRDYAVLTAYFVHPYTICTSGRTVSDLNNQGTGYGLWFQNGRSPTALINVPRKRAAASALGWTDCECYPGMGLHNFFEVHKWQETECDRARPAQVTYNLDEEMTGFVFQFTGPSTSARLERARTEAIIAIIGALRIPQCAIDKNTQFGYTSLHIYFIDDPTTLVC